MTKEQHDEFVRTSSEMEKESRITVGELQTMLRGYDPSMEITFGSTLNADPLAFQRIKVRGDDLLQIELMDLTPSIVLGG